MDRTVQNLSKIRESKISLKIPNSENRQKNMFRISEYPKIEFSQKKSNFYINFLTTNVPMGDI